MRRSTVPFLTTLLLTGALTAQAKEPAPKPAPARATVDFAKEVWPILERRCVECHRTAHAGADGKVKKPKGGVTLDSRTGIETSKKGKLVVAGKPADSLLHQAITLPADDEDRMPPAKKGEPLSKAEIDLIKRWIEGGAAFGAWTGGKPATPPKDGAGGKDAGSGKTGGGATGSDPRGGDAEGRGETPRADGKTGPDGRN
jgi:hypothetical protein